MKDKPLYIIGHNPDVNGKIAEEALKAGLTVVIAEEEKLPRLPPEKVDIYAMKAFEGITHIEPSGKQKRRERRKRERKQRKG